MASFLSSVGRHLCDLDEPPPLVLLHVQIEPLPLQGDSSGGQVPSLALSSQQVALTLKNQRFPTHLVAPSIHLIVRVRHLSMLAACTTKCLF